MKTLTEQLEEWQELAEYEIPDYLLEDVRTLLLQAEKRTREEIIEDLIDLIADPRTPHQALKLQDNCPHCGTEPNPRYVDRVCGDIRDETLRKVVKIIRNGKSIH